MAKNIRYIWQNRIKEVEREYVITGISLKRLLYDIQNGIFILTDNFRTHDVKETYKKPGNVFLGLVHRLDRPVSGIILFAKTSKIY